MGVEREFKNMDFGGLQMAEDFKGEEAQNMSAGREVLAELVAEKESLDQSYVHCVRLLDQGKGAEMLFPLELILFSYCRN